MKNKKQMYDDIHKIANYLEEVKNKIRSMEMDTDFVCRFIRGDLQHNDIRFVSTAKATKDSEILDILKPRFHLHNSRINGYDVAFIEVTGFVFEHSKEYEILKEWLDNDQ